METREDDVGVHCTGEFETTKFDEVFGALGSDKTLTLRCSGTDWVQYVSESAAASGRSTMQQSHLEPVMTRQSDDGYTVQSLPVVLVNIQPIPVPDPVVEEPAPDPAVEEPDQEPAADPTAGP